MEEANLTNADLLGAQLLRADLRRANLTACQLIRANLDQALVEDAIIDRIYIDKLAGFPVLPERLRGQGVVLPAETSQRFFEQSSVFQMASGGASARSIAEQTELAQKFVEARDEIEHVLANDERLGEMLETLGKLAGALEREDADASSICDLWTRLYKAAPTAAAIVRSAAAVQQALS